MTDPDPTADAPRGLFITGTDTGVGKTIVAAGLVMALRQRRLNVAAMKPVETGVPGLVGRWPDTGGAMPQDGLMLASAMAWAMPLAEVVPVAFAEPLAPSVAAERSGAPIEVPAISDAYRLLADRYDGVVVEGAGGLAVPLTREVDFADLAARLGLAVLVVARPGLGTINHTVLTIRYARERGLPVAGFVINAHPGDGAGVPEETNPGVIADLTGAPLLGKLPWSAQPLDTATACADLVADRVDLPAIAAACGWPLDG